VEEIDSGVKSVDDKVRRMGTMVGKMKSDLVGERAGNFYIVKDAKHFTARKKREIMNWFCPAEIDELGANISHWTQDTTTWIFNESLYKTWVSTPGHMLWLQGKGIFSSLLINLWLTVFSGIW
jgi:hypothetical protein